jgi:hypothetical protein
MTASSTMSLFLHCKQFLYKTTIEITFLRATYVEIDANSVKIKM